MGSFNNNNDSQNNIKSTEETHNIGNKKKTDKAQFLPNIKVNIYIDGNQKYKNDSDDSDMEQNKDNILTYMKLPKIKPDAQKNFGKNQGTLFNSNGFNNKNNNFKNNISNNSVGKFLHFNSI